LAGAIDDDEGEAVLYVAADHCAQQLTPCAALTTLTARHRSTASAREEIHGG